jgi:hypothetical protein
MAARSALVKIFGDLIERVRFAKTCMGLFLSSGCYWVFLTVLCSERERPFFVPSPAISSRGDNQWPGDIAAWREAGGSHISVVTMGANLTTVDGHIEAIKRWRAVYNSVR